MVLYSFILFWISFVAIISLMFPFHWSHVFIPVLPEQFFEFTSAPVPFLMGLCVDDSFDPRRVPTEVNCSVILLFPYMFGHPYHSCCSWIRTDFFLATPFVVTIWILYDWNFRGRLRSVLLISSSLTFL